MHSMCNRSELQLSFRGRQRWWSNSHEHTRNHIAYTVTYPPSDAVTRIKVKIHILHAVLNPQYQVIGRNHSHNVFRPLLCARESTTVPPTSPQLCTCTQYSFHAMEVVECHLKFSFAYSSSTIRIYGTGLSKRWFAIPLESRRCCRSRGDRGVQRQRQGHSDRPQSGKKACHGTNRRCRSWSEVRTMHEHAFYASLLIVII